MVSTVYFAMTSNSVRLVRDAQSLMKCYRLDRSVFNLSEFILQMWCSDHYLCDDLEALECIVCQFVCVCDWIDEEMKGAPCDLTEF